MAVGFVFAAPETRPPADPRPRYRPQRVSVPTSSRPRYFAAGLLLAAYLGLAGPVIGLGVALQYLSPRVSLLVFAGALAAGMLIATPALLGRSRRAQTPERGGARKHERARAPA